MSGTDCSPLCEVITDTLDALVELNFSAVAHASPFGLWRKEWKFFLTVLVDAQQQTLVSDGIPPQGRQLRVVRIWHPDLYLTEEKGGGQVWKQKTCQ